MPSAMSAPICAMRWYDNGDGVDSCRGQHMSASVVKAATGTTRAVVTGVLGIQARQLASTESTSAGHLGAAVAQDGLEIATLHQLHNHQKGLLLGAHPQQPYNLVGPINRPGYKRNKVNKGITGLVMGCTGLYFMISTSLLKSSLMSSPTLVSICLMNCKRLGESV